MATDVIMPQMGESIAEGTVTKWLKKVGDNVERDEPLFEISTDKVDAEIPSPAEGTLTEIVVQEGETVEINTIVARIAAEGAAPSSGGEPASAPAEKPAAPSAPAPAPPAAPAPAAAPSAGGAVAVATREERVRTKSSPVVRKIAAEKGIDITQVPGTGVHGRVTKADILQYVEGGGAPAPAVATTAAVAPATARMEVRAPVLQPGANDRIEPMSNMRKKIAEHMVMSKAVSPHVHTLYEVDMSQVDRLRKAHKQEFLQSSGGAKLTYTVFMMKAVIDALEANPVVNSSISGDNIIYHGDINLGLAVALDWGLIVPVVKRAQDLSMTGLARALTDLATRARNKQLKPDEVAGGTFTITNPGSYGGLVGMPIINQPNVAILGMGKVEKRVCVVDDMIAIRPKMFMSLGYDHRIVDGATAEQFLSHVNNTLENFDETAL